MMKPETLDALAIDHALGELPPETAELFAAYLEAVPSARHAAEAMTEVVRATRDTIRQYTDLAPRTRPAPVGCPAWRPGPWLARAAAVGLVLGGGIWIGRRAAPVPTASPRRTDAVSTIQSAAVESPWARYQVAYDERTGGHVLAQYQ